MARGSRCAVATLHWASRRSRASELLQLKSVTIALEFTLKSTRVRYSISSGAAAASCNSSPCTRALPGRIMPRANHFRSRPSPLHSINASQPTFSFISPPVLATRASAGCRPARWAILHACTCSTRTVTSSGKQQAASSKQQAASSKQQAASSKQQAASSKQQAASSKQQAASSCLQPHAPASHHART